MPPSLLYSVLLSPRQINHSCSIVHPSKDLHTDIQCLRKTDYRPLNNHLEVSALNISMIVRQLRPEERDQKPKYAVGRCVLRRFHQSEHGFDQPTTIMGGSDAETVGLSKGEVPY
jgi:hypothetical protein